MSPDYVSSREIAERLGVSLRTVQTWRSRGRLPEPAFWVNGEPGTKGATPVWLWSAVYVWAVGTKRLPMPTLRDAMEQAERGEFIPYPTPPSSGSA